MVFQSGSFCRTLPGFLGNLFDNTGASNVVVFAAGSTYEHQAGLHPFGLTQPASRIVLQTGSLVRYLAGSGNGSFGGRVYADLVYNPNPPVNVIGGAPVPVTVDNFTILSGGFSGTAGTLYFDIKGNLTVSGTGLLEIVPASVMGTLKFSGTSEQFISGNGTIRLGTLTDLVVANPAGLSLGRYLFTDGNVSLSGGKLVTGLYMLHLGHTGTVTGPYWVVGNLGRIMPGSAGTVTRTFEMGDALAAAPLTLSFASVSDSGTILARTDPGDHPSRADAGLDPAQSVNRQWIVQNLGVGFTTYDVTLQFNPAEVDAAANPASFSVGKYDGGLWTLPTVGTRTATSTQAVALSSLSTFAVAELGPVGVEPIVSASTSLSSARPTPFRAGTVLEYSLARSETIDLSIYGADGRRIRTLERGVRSAGLHGISWDGRDSQGRNVPAGIYFVRLATPSALFQRRAVKVE